MPELLKPYIPLIEIAILAIVFYVILRFIRGTRGAGVLRGAVVVFAVVFIVLQRITEGLGLLRIRRALDWALSTSVLALVVIFWPELRRALIQLGQLRILRLFDRPAAPPFLDAVVAAAERLAGKRNGAIIVIERDMNLSAYVDEGVPVDAAVTPEMLETIFFPRSVLHDGAVIIQHERILAAGCLLPLSDAPNLAKNLGTRHRAALGLTEETDAVSVVVSEETGQISVAVRGALTTDISPERLKPLLVELYTGQANEARAAEPAAAPGAGATKAGGAAPEAPVQPGPVPTTSEAHPAKTATGTDEHPA